MNRCWAFAVLLLSPLVGCETGDIAASGGDPSAISRGGSGGSGGPGAGANPGGSANAGYSLPPSPSNVGGSGGAMMPPGSNTGDRYTSPGTNPFVLTASDAFSTFAVDVDTASYDIFRRDVNLGTLPQPASVRLEEYVNAFRYDYQAPAAESDTPFKISVAAATHALDRPTALVRVGIQGRTPPPQARRQANLVFLVDTSGSMQSPDKLPLVQETLVHTLEMLAPTDKVSIVSYAGDTTVRLAPTPAADQAVITAAIQGLRSGGSTAGAAGLTLAYQQAQAGFISEGINHIVLCTDGDFNVGPSSTKELLQLIREKRKTGVTLTVLGYGVGNLNDDMMEAVADAGNGIYGMISSSENARSYVSNHMLSTLVHIAKDVKIQVEFNPDTVQAYRLLGYENRAIADQDFRNDVVDAGEIGAGHRVTALYELVLAGGTVPERAGAPAVSKGETSDLKREIAASDLVLVKVRWKGIDATETTPAQETSATLATADVSDGVSAADPDLQWAAAVASLAEVLKRSPYADAGQLPAIRQIVDAQAARDEGRREFAALLAKAMPMLAGR